MRKRGGKREKKTMETFFQVVKTGAGLFILFLVKIIIIMKKIKGGHVRYSAHMYINVYLYVCIYDYV